MITWHEELSFDFSDVMTNEHFTEHDIFFDIETTGFSPARTTLYMIGCATRKDDLLCLDQFFAESKADEVTVLTSFLEFLAGYDTIITFNGIGFDIPYLKAKCNSYGLQEPFSSYNYLDIYKEVSRLKHLFGLPSLKQKSIEDFLGIDRIDSYSGGELIEVYKEYTKHPSKEALALLRQHNYEDVLYMPKLLPVLSYHKIAEGVISLSSLEANEYTAYDGTPQKELIFTLELSTPVPKPVSLRYDSCYLTVGGSTARLCIQLVDDRLRFFYDNPKDYYYLPKEDCAIHKSIAGSVDKEYRKQANASTCYTWKHALFLPQYEDIVTPVFHIQPKDKLHYFELSEYFIASPEIQTRYVKHLISVMFSKRKSKTSPSQ